MVLRNGSNLSSDWSEMNGTGADDGATSQAIRVDELDHFDEAWVKPFPLRDGLKIRKGERFSDYYTLFEEIGEGKFGKVYRCVEKATNLMLAAKCIKIRKDTDFEKVEKEVNIMTQMRHKCIAQIYDAFATTDNDVILIMEIVQGGELFDRVADDSYILTEMAVALIMFQICEAIRYIHSQNIIHLDLKPENIMCVSQTSNQIKLIDFGLAQWYDGSKDLMFMAGTPEFAAPEVIKYEPLDFHTDMWSLGVIAYILLSGQSPFLGETLAHTYCNVERGNWMFCEEFAENGISSDAKDFISKLLILNKERRMLPDECLRHPWIRKNRERALLASRAASPAACHPLAVDKFRKYVKNKRFRRLVFGVLFINEVMRMMQTMQRNKSAHGVEYVRNMLVAAEKRADGANNDEMKMDTSSNVDDDLHQQQQTQVVVSVTPVREERDDVAQTTSCRETTTTTAAMEPVVATATNGDTSSDKSVKKKKVVVIKRIVRRDGDDHLLQQQQQVAEKKKRSKSEARRATDQQRTRSSTEQTSNKKQRQADEKGQEVSAVQNHHHHQQKGDASTSVKKSPLVSRRLGEELASKSPLMARRSQEQVAATSDSSKSPKMARRAQEPAVGTSDSFKSPLMARRLAPAVEKSVKFEDMPTTATMTRTAVPKIDATVASPTTVLKKRTGSDGGTNVLRIAARLVEEHSCAPCTSSATNSRSSSGLIDNGRKQRLLSAEATVPKKTVPSLSSSNVSALLKKLEQRGVEAGAGAATTTAARSAAATGTTALVSPSASPLSLAVTAIGPLKKDKEEEKKQRDGEKKEQQKVAKLVKKKKKVLRVRTTEEEAGTEQRRPKQRLDNAAAATPVASIASGKRQEEEKSLGIKQKQHMSDKAQNGRQMMNGGEMTTASGQKQQLIIGQLSPRAKQRLRATNSLPLGDNRRRGAHIGGESMDEMDDGGWGVVGQDVFDFSLLRKKLQNRIMGLKDKEDLETEAENQQRFELQKQQNMLRTNLNIKRAMRKWISMDKETKQYQQHNHNNGMLSRGEAFPDWAR